MHYGVLLQRAVGTSDDGPYQRCLHHEIQRRLAGSISRLPHREQQVLALSYYEELTMKDIGAVMGVGESRISQIHSTAPIGLRRILANHGPGRGERAKLSAD